MRELLDSIKPEGVPNAHVAPSTYSTPTPVRSAPPSGLVARYPTASELWSVPMPQAARQSKAFDPQLWAPDPNASAAYRRVAGSAPAISTTDALRQVRYPQRTATKPTEIRHHRPVDWQSTSAPSSASYFDALQRAKRNAAAAKTETRVGRAQAHVKYGFDLARRGAAHSAEQEFTEALWAVAHANDARAGNRQHADALRQGLLALEEAEEFSPLVRSQDSCVEAQPYCRAAQKHGRSSRCQAAAGRGVGDAGLLGSRPTRFGSVAGGRWSWSGSALRPFAFGTSEVPKWFLRQWLGGSEGDGLAVGCPRRSAG